MTRRNSGDESPDTHSSGSSQRSTQRGHQRSASDDGTVRPRAGTVGRRRAALVMNFLQDSAQSPVRRTGQIWRKPIGQAFEHSYPIRSFAVGGGITGGLRQPVDTRVDPNWHPAVNPASRRASAAATAMPAPAEPRDASAAQSASVDADISAAEEYEEEHSDANSQRAAVSDGELETGSLRGVKRTTSNLNRNDFQTLLQQWRGARESQLFSSTQPTGIGGQSLARRRRTYMPSQSPEHALRGYVPPSGGAHQVGLQYSNLQPPGQTTLESRTTMQAASMLSSASQPNRPSQIIPLPPSSPSRTSPVTTDEQLELAGREGAAAGIALVPPDDHPYIEVDDWESEESRDSHGLELMGLTAAAAAAAAGIALVPPDDHYSATGIDDWESEESRNDNGFGLTGPEGAAGVGATSMRSEDPTAGSRKVSHEEVFLELGKLDAEIAAAQTASAAEASGNTRLYGEYDSYGELSRLPSNPPPHATSFPSPTEPRQRPSQAAPSTINTTSSAETPVGRNLAWLQRTEGPLQRHTPSCQAIQSGHVRNTREQFRGEAPPPPGESREHNTPYRNTVYGNIANPGGRRENDPRIVRPHSYVPSAYQFSRRESSSPYRTPYQPPISPTGEIPGTAFRSHLASLPHGGRPHEFSFSSMTETPASTSSAATPSAAPLPPPIHLPRIDPSSLTFLLNSVLIETDSAELKLQEVLYFIIAEPPVDNKLEHFLRNVPKVDVVLLAMLAMMNRTLDYPNFILPTMVFQTIFILTKFYHNKAEQQVGPLNKRHPSYPVKNEQARKIDSKTKSNEAWGEIGMLVIFAMLGMGLRRLQGDKRPSHKNYLYIYDTTKKHTHQPQPTLIEKIPAASEANKLKILLMSQPDSPILLKRLLKEALHIIPAHLVEEIRVEFLRKRLKETLEASEQKVVDIIAQRFSEELIGTSEESFSSDDDRLSFEELINHCENSDLLWRMIVDTVKEKEEQDRRVKSGNSQEQRSSVKSKFQLEMEIENCKNGEFIEKVFAQLVGNEKLVNFSINKCAGRQSDLFLKYWEKHLDYLMQAGHWDAVSYFLRAVGERFGTPHPDDLLDDEPLKGGLIENKFLAEAKNDHVTRQERDAWLNIKDGNKSIIPKGTETLALRLTDYVAQHRVSNNRTGLTLQSNPAEELAKTLAFFITDPLAYRSTFNVADAERKEFSKALQLMVLLRPVITEGQHHNWCYLVKPHTVNTEAFLRLSEKKQIQLLCTLMLGPDCTKLMALSLMHATGKRPKSDDTKSPEESGVPVVNDRKLKAPLDAAHDFSFTPIKQTWRATLVSILKAYIAQYDSNKPGDNASKLKRQELSQHIALMTYKMPTRMEVVFKHDHELAADVLGMLIVAGLQDGPTVTRVDSPISSHDSSPSTTSVMRTGDARRRAGKGPASDRETTYLLLEDSDDDSVTIPVDHRTKLAPLQNLDELNPAYDIDGNRQAKKEKAYLDQAQTLFWSVSNDHRQSILAAMEKSGREMAPLFWLTKENQERMLSAFASEDGFNTLVQLFASSDQEAQVQALLVLGQMVQCDELYDFRQNFLSYFKMHPEYFTGRTRLEGLAEKIHMLGLDEKYRFKFACTLIQAILTHEKNPKKRGQQIYDVYQQVIVAHVSTPLNLFEMLINVSKQFPHETTAEQQQAFIDDAIGYARGKARDPIYAFSAGQQQDVLSHLVRKYGEAGDARQHRQDFKIYSHLLTGIIRSAKGDYPVIEHLAKMAASHSPHALARMVVHATQAVFASEHEYTIKNEILFIFYNQYLATAVGTTTIEVLKQLDDMVSEELGVSKEGVSGFDAVLCCIGLAKSLFEKAVGSLEKSTMHTNHILYRCEAEDLLKRLIKPAYYKKYNGDTLPNAFNPNQRKRLLECLPLMALCQGFTNNPAFRELYRYLLLQVFNVTTDSGRSISFDMAPYADKFVDTLRVLHHGRDSQPLVETLRAEIQEIEKLIAAKRGRHHQFDPGVGVEVKRTMVATYIYGLYNKKFSNPGLSLLDTEWKEISQALQLGGWDVSLENIKHQFFGMPRTLEPISPKARRTFKASQSDVETLSETFKRLSFREEIARIIYNGVRQSMQPRSRVEFYTDSDGFTEEESLFGTHRGTIWSQSPPMAEELTWSNHKNGEGCAGDDDLDDLPEEFSMGSPGAGPSNW